MTINNVLNTLETGTAIAVVDREAVKSLLAAMGLGDGEGSIEQRQVTRADVYTLAALHGLQVQPIPDAATAERNADAALAEGWAWTYARALHNLEVVLAGEDDTDIIKTLETSCDALKDGIARALCDHLANFDY